MTSVIHLQSPPVYPMPQDEGRGLCSASGPAETFCRVLSVGPEYAGERLDRVLAALLPEFSRGCLQRWIEGGQVLVDGRPRRSKDRLWGGESIRIEARLLPAVEPRPQPIALEILYEDPHLLVINKPPGLVVHPAAGNPDGTLQNALLHHDPGLAALPRAGIVHRLDKDTSGLLVVARTLKAHYALVEQLRQRQVQREYLALVQGRLIAGGRIEAPIGRHPTQRTRMAVVPDGRPAVTHYRIAESFRGHTLLAVRLETGRTHQIRVHLAYIRHPIVGDQTYGGRLRLPRGCSPELIAALQSFPRQALHAARLGLIHPETGAEHLWEAPLPADLAGLIERLRQESGLGADRA